MSDVQRSEAEVPPLDLVILHERPGRALVAQHEQLVVVIDVGGLGHDGGRVALDALAGRRAAHPRPRPIVNFTIVGESAPRPDAREREIGRLMGEHLSAFVCVIEGTSVRARWVRRILAAISSFSPRRNPMFFAPSIEEGAAIVARELDLDASALAAAVTALRARAGA